MLPLDQGLRRVFAEPTCVVGVGNTLRSDDGVGVLIAERLADELANGSRHAVVSAEDVIENHVFRIADGPSRNVLVVDAVQGQGASERGALVFGRLEEIEADGLGWSTHKLALSTAASVLRHHGKDVYLLGIVVANTDYGTAVSPEILASAEAVLDLLRMSSKE